MIPKLVIAAIASVSSLSVIVVPTAGADACPDADVSFARGTNEPPGLGGTGQEFVDSFRSDLGDAKSVTVYPVNYPATMDYSSAIDEPKHEMTAAVTKPLWTLVWTPVALVWDAVTFPPQVLFGVYPYGDSHMQPATRLDSK